MTRSPRPALATRRLTLALVLGAGALTGGCSELPTVVPGVCGNGVIEPPEACDRFSDDPEAACGEPGTPAACRFVCAPDGARPTCPAGFGCGRDGTCRAASGGFRPITFAGDFLAAAHQLEVADVDGDGLADLIAFTLGGVSVRFGSADGRFLDELEFPVPLQGAEGDVTDVNADGRADILVPVGSGALVLLGQAERALVPAPFLQPVGSEDAIARIRLAEAPAEPGRLATVLVGPFASGSDPGGRGTYLEVSSLSSVGRTATTLPVGFGDGRPAVALSSRDDGALLAAVAFTGGRSVALAAFTVEAPCPGGSCWPRQSVATRRLDPPQSLAATARLETIRGRPSAREGAWSAEPGLHVADVADDDGLDVVALFADASGERHAVVWPGPSFDSAFVIDDASRARLGVNVDPNGWPLAFGELDGDGSLDTVRADGIWSSAAGRRVARPQLESWTDAVVADFNRDGRPDVAASSAFIEGVDVFFGTGLPLFNRSRIDTSAAVDRLATGDFDGDFVTDLLFAERTFEDVGGDASTLFLAPGRLQGTPGPKVTVGKLSYIQEILPLFLPGLELDLVEDVLVHSTAEVDGRGEALVALLQGSTDGRLVSFIGGDEGTSQTVRAGRLSAAGSSATDLLVARRVGADADSMSSAFVVITGDGSGVYSGANETSLELTACTRGFDLQTAAITVEPLADDDAVESLFIVDKPPCEDVSCPSTLLVSRGDAGENECWWSDLVGPPGGVPTDLVVDDIDGNGARELVVGYGFDATPIRGGVFKDLSSAARQTGLAVYWDLDVAAYGTGSGAVDEAAAFERGEVYTTATALGAEPPPEEVTPGADGVGRTNALAGVRSVRLIQADGDPEREVLVLSSDGLFVAELAKPGLTLRRLDLPFDPGVALQQVRTNDVNGDGVDDIIVSRGERFQVHLGRAAGEEAPP